PTATATPSLRHATEWNGPAETLTYESPVGSGGTLLCPQSLYPVPNAPDWAVARRPVASSARQRTPRLHKKRRNPLARWAGDDAESRAASSLAAARELERMRGQAFGAKSEDGADAAVMSSSREGIRSLPLARTAGRTSGRFWKKPVAIG